MRCTCTRPGARRARCTYVRRACSEKHNKTLAHGTGTSTGTGAAAGWYYGDVHAQSAPGPVHLDRGTPRRRARAGRQSRAGSPVPPRTCKCPRAHRPEARAAACANGGPLRPCHRQQALPRCAGPARRRACGGARAAKDTRRRRPRRQALRSRWPQKWRTRDAPQCRAAARGLAHAAADSVPRCMPRTARGRGRTRRRKRASCAGPRACSGRPW